VSPGAVSIQLRRQLAGSPVGVAILLAGVAIQPAASSGQKQDESTAGNLMRDWPEPGSATLPFVLPDPEDVRSPPPPPTAIPEEELIDAPIPNLPTRRTQRLSVRDWRTPQGSLIQESGRSMTVQAGAAALEISNDFRDVAVRLEIASEAGDTRTVILPPEESESLLLEPGRVTVRRESWRPERSAPPLKESFEPIDLLEGYQYVIRLDQSGEREILRVIDAPLWGSR